MRSFSTDKSLLILNTLQYLLSLEYNLSTHFYLQERKCSEVSVEVKKSQHKYVIGPKGSQINEILSETGVFVEMPSSDSPSETITLRGPQDKLGLGKFENQKF